MKNETTATTLLLCVLTSTLMATLTATVGCMPDGGPPAGPRSNVTRIDPAPLRRLSAAEYQNTLTDLFPGLDVDAPPLPPDPRVNGFTNDARSLVVSQLHLARLEEGARLYAAAAVQSRLAQLLGCERWETDAEQEACTETFLESFGRRVFRSPPAPEWQEAIRARMTVWRERIDFAASIELAIVSMLMSPEFLYRLEPSIETDAPTTPVNGYELASRLSYALWGSTPDDSLLDAASDGTLLQDDVLQAQVERLLDDPRAEQMWVRFHVAWLGIDDLLTDEHRNRLAHPTWNEATQHDAHEALTRFFRHLYTRDPTLSAILQNRTAFLSPALAAFYGVEAAENWGAVQLPVGERAGVLSRIAVLAARSHPGYASPPLRGNYVRTKLLCGPHLNPPPNIDLTQPTPMENAGPQTNRQLFEIRGSAAVCQGCHVQLDGLGFGFEHYDAAGVFQTEDNGLPVDASGLLLGTNVGILDVDGPYTGVIELSERLAHSTTVHRCYTSRVVQRVYGATIEDEHFMDELVGHFVASGGDGRELLRTIALHPRFRLRAPRGE